MKISVPERADAEHPKMIFISNPDVTKICGLFPLLFTLFALQKLCKYLAISHEEIKRPFMIFTVTAQKFRKEKSLIDIRRPQNSF